MEPDQLPPPTDPGPVDLPTAEGLTWERALRLAIDSFGPNQPAPTTDDLIARAKKFIEGAP